MTDGIEGSCQHWYEASPEKFWPVFESIDNGTLRGQISELLQSAGHDHSDFARRAVVKKARFIRDAFDSRSSDDAIMSELRTYLDEIINTLTPLLKKQPKEAIVVELLSVGVESLMKERTDLLHRFADIAEKSRDLDQDALGADRLIIDIQAHLEKVKKVKKAEFLVDSGIELLVKVKAFFRERSTLASQYRTAQTIKHIFSR